MGILKCFVFLLGIQLSKSKIQTINVDSNDLELSKLLRSSQIHVPIFRRTICRKEQELFFYLSLPFTGEVDCPLLSQNVGRCGPSWGGRCNKKLADYAVYCNEENGWCGVTSAHKYAQSSDIYDWEPESCNRLSLKRNEF